MRDPVDVARGAVAACESSLIGVPGAGEIAQLRRAATALLHVVEKQQSQIARLEREVEGLDVRTFGSQVIGG